jgi:hypothetical protein
MWGDPLNSDTSAVLLNTKFEVYGADQVHPGDTGFDIIAGVEATIGSIIPVLLNTKFEVYGADQVHPGDTGFDIIAGVEATIGSIIPDPKRFSLQCAQSRMTWSAPELGTTITHVFPSLPRPPD